MHHSRSRAKRLALPFDLEPVMAGAFDFPPWAAEDLPALRTAWERAHQQGVAAAVNHDHHLFAHRAGCFDPSWERDMYSDGAALSPWTPDNVCEQLPDLDEVAVRALTPTVWLLEQWSYCEHGSRVPAANWEVVFPRLLDDPVRTAFWASAMVERFFVCNTRRTPRFRLRMGIRQTPLGIFSLVVPCPMPEELEAVQRWIVGALPALMRRMATHGNRYDYTSEHRCFAAPLMLQVERQWHPIDRHGFKSQ